MKATTATASNSASSKLELIYGKATAERVQTCNVLVVGAGGIGCELMKTLSVSGFKRVTIIDLDTIDVSNLNRQFLFRKEHVDKSKAEVVREQIVKQNPSIEVKSFVGRIQEERFGFRFFSEFDIVINALDNEEARKHVNQMCFNLNIPLVDSGTNGYAAQCISICKGKTPCYQCVERPKDQSFPVCTIRQKPEKLIHCIVWAKALFEGLFGPKENSNNIIQDIVEEIHQASQSGCDYIEQAHIIFDKVFKTEVKVLVDNLNARLQKVELPQETNVKALEDIEVDRTFINKINVLDFSNFKQKITAKLKELDFSTYSPSNEETHTVLPLETQVFNFSRALAQLHTTRTDQLGSLTFSKDDDLIVDFVAAATNLRAANFSIPLESQFKIKEMAGKIIPAISSSNAMVAALQISEAIKVLGGKYDQLKGIVYQRTNPARLQAFNRLNDQPSKDCPICQDDSKFIYTLDVKDLASVTLKNLVTEVLCFSGGLGLGPNFLLELNNDILYEQDEDMDEDDLEMYQRRLKKTLASLKFKDLSILQVQGSLASDSQGSPETSIYIQVFESPSIQTPPFQLTLLKKGVPKKVTSVALNPQVEEAKNLNEGKVDAEGNVHLSDDSDDDLAIDEQQEVVAPLAGKKRMMKGQNEVDKIEEANSAKKRVKE